MAKILIVEDHADSREALAIYLRRIGHLVDCAADGREAMIHIVDRPPDLVMLDLNMPEMNGVDVIETVRSYVRLHFLPVVILTASPDGDLARRAKALQVGPVLKKGTASLDEISAAIENTLNDAAHRRTGNRLEKWRNDEISPL
jgi:DNA-binding response OmpR family regulator